MTPIYDFDILPAITLPFGSSKEATRKYLGGRALTGEEYMTLDIFMIDNTEALALYNFWETDCNYGTTPFLVALPLFGETYDKAYPTTMVQFYEDITAEKIDIHWKQSIKVKVLGTINYIQDDSLNYIVDDSGELIIDDTVSNSNKEITHGS